MFVKICKYRTNSKSGYIYLNFETQFGAFKNIFVTSRLRDNYYNLLFLKR